MNKPEDKPEMAKAKSAARNQGPQDARSQAAAGDGPSDSPNPEPLHRDAAGGESVSEAEAGTPGNGTESADAVDAPPPPPEEAALADDGESEAAEEAEELEELRNEAKANFEKFLLVQADFENYKKRVTKEHADSLKFASTPLVREMAGIIDNLERAVEHTRNGQGDTTEGLVDGIEMVIKQVHETLENFNVTRIEAAGKTFDPELHEAMTVVETNDVPENQVIDVFQTGYRLHGRVVRPARVSVSKRPAEE